MSTGIVAAVGEREIHAIGGRGNGRKWSIDLKVKIANRADVAFCQLVNQPPCRVHVIEQIYILNIKALLDGFNRFIFRDTVQMQKGDQRGGWVEVIDLIGIDQQYPGSIFIDTQVQPA